MASSAALETLAGLRKQTYDLLSIVRPPTDEERAELIRAQRRFQQFGNVRFFRVETKSVAELIAERPEYFGHVTSDHNLRSYVPPAMEFASLDGLNGARAEKPEIQFKFVAARSARLQQLGLPEARAVILPSAALVQRDIQIAQRTGRVGADYRRALEELPNSRVYGAAAVGRRDINDRLDVFDANSTLGANPEGGLWASPVVIFIRG